jgi:hypothetical protein
MLQYRPCVPYSRLHQYVSGSYGGDVPNPLNHKELLLTAINIWQTVVLLHPSEAESRNPKTADTDVESHGLALRCRC